MTGRMPRLHLVKKGAVLWRRPRVGAMPGACRDRSVRLGGVPSAAHVLVRPCSLQDRRLAHQPVRLHLVRGGGTVPDHRMAVQPSQGHQGPGERGRVGGSVFQRGWQARVCVRNPSTRLLESGASCRRMKCGTKSGACGATASPVATAAGGGDQRVEGGAVPDVLPAAPGPTGLRTRRRQRGRPPELGAGL